MERTGGAPVWPDLTLDRWVDTRDTFQLWTQVIGKVRLANTSLTNHWWNVPLYVSARGRLPRRGDHAHVAHDPAAVERYWPGPHGEGVFSSYAYPEPEDHRSTPVAPAEARYDDALGEFVLPYTAVRTAAGPDATLLAFLRSTYDAAADSGAWDRGALERRPPG